MTHPSSAGQGNNDQSRRNTYIVYGATALITGIPAGKVSYDYFKGEATKLEGRKKSLELAELKHQTEIHQDTAHFAENSALLKKREQVMNHSYAKEHSGAHTGRNVMSAVGGAGCGLLAACAAVVVVKTIKHNM